MNLKVLPLASKRSKRLVLTNLTLLILLRIATCVAAAPFQLTQQGNWPGHTPTAACDIRIVDSNAYVATTDGRLLILDIADPKTLRLLGSCRVPDLGCEDVRIDVAGSKVYILRSPPGYGAALAVIDATDLSQPRHLVTCGIPGLANGLSVHGTYVYLPGAAYEISTSGHKTVVVMDVQNPLQPRQVAVYTSANGHDWFGGTCIVSNRLYVVGESLLEVLDISNPTAPVEIGHSGAPWPATDVQVVGDYAYVASTYEGFAISRVDNLRSIPCVFRFDPTHIEISVQGVVVLRSGVKTGLESAFQAVFTGVSRRFYASTLTSLLVK